MIFARGPNLSAAKSRGTYRVGIKARGAIAMGEARELGPKGSRGISWRDSHGPELCILKKRNVFYYWDGFLLQ